MRKLHKKPLIMAAATLALTGTLAVGSAMAYFTTYSTAGGGVKMNMGFTETVPKEDVDENGKHITIENTGNYDCFVRVTAFAPVKLTYNAPDGGWTDRGDGYWYYDEVLPAKAKTTNQTFSVPCKDQCDCKTNGGRPDIGGGCQNGRKGHNSQSYIRYII